MPAKTTRRILKTGDSKAVALPPDWLRMFGLDIGDEVDCIYGSVVIFKPKGVSLDIDVLKKELELIERLERTK